MSKSIPDSGLALGRARDRGYGTSGLRLLWLGGLPGLEPVPVTFVVTGHTSEGVPDYRLGLVWRVHGGLQGMGCQYQVSHGSDKKMKWNGGRWSPASPGYAEVVTFRENGFGPGEAGIARGYRYCVEIYRCKTCKAGKDSDPHLPHPALHPNSKFTEIPAWDPKSPRPDRVTMLPPVRLTA